MDNMEAVTIETAQRCKSNTHRIDALEEQSKILNDLVTSVKLMAQNIEQMTKELTEQNARLKTLEQQPGERWNNMTRTIFTTVISTLAGGIVGALVAILIK